MTGHTPGMAPATAGQVWAHVGQPFTPDSWDVLVLGAGRMGTAVTLFLRDLRPEWRVLLVEEGGLPNEDGATILAPGLWTLAGLPEARHAEAQWERAQLEGRFGGAGGQARTLLSLGQDGEEDTATVLARHPELAGVVDPAGAPRAAVHEAFTYRPGALALAAGQAAVRAGADLLLNTRASLIPGGACLERLTVTNTHQIVTHETHEVRAPRVVVALGAAGPHATEHGLGVHTRHARAYRQTPRLNVPTTDTTPVLHAAGLTLRPQSGGVTIIPPVHHRDPHGYAPQGGQLTGVPTGLRRETLEDLVSALEVLPALGTDALETGRSLADVPGAWLALPHGDPAGLPWHGEVAPGVHLLLGGPQADTLGLSTAYRLAAQLAGVALPEGWAAPFSPR